MREDIAEGDGRWAYSASICYTQGNMMDERFDDSSGEESQ